MKRWIQFSVIFVVGFLLGSAATGLYISHCMTRLWMNSGCHDHILDRISGKLGLSPDQRTKVDAILKTEDASVNQLREDGRQKFKSIRDDIDAQIRTILAPDQLKKLDQWKTEREAPPSRHGFFGFPFHQGPPPDAPPPAAGK